MKSKNSLQLTLAILKPHVVKSPFALQKIRDIIIDNGFKVVRSKRTVISAEEADLFYSDHREKFFYNRLLTFMCSGPSDIHILAGLDAIKKWRELMGPTKVYQAQFTAPNTIRAMYGLSDTRNATHGSGIPLVATDTNDQFSSATVKIFLFFIVPTDSLESADREIKIFFKEFNTKEWFDNEEEFYNLGKIRFDPSAFLHTIDQSAQSINIAKNPSSD